MSTKRYTYELNVKDRLRPALEKIKGISTGTYSKLARGQQQFNTTVAAGSQKVTGLQSRLTGMIGTYLTLGMGVMAARNTMKKWDAQVQAEAQVMQGLQSTNMAAGRSFDQLTKAASNLQQKTLFGDESILQGVTAQMLTFTNVTGTAFDRVQKAALDVTARLNGAKATTENLRSTSIMLGKALNDPISNLGLLSRSGIQFSDSQKEMIKNLWKAGDAASAQAMILDELEKQYGGSAEAAAKVGMGPWQQFMNMIGDIQEKFGPMLNNILKGLMSLFEWVKRNSEWLSILTATVLGALTAYKLITTATKIWTAVQWAFNASMAANPIMLIIIGIAALAAAIYAVIKKTKGWSDQWQNFKDVVSNIWERLKLKFASWVGNLTLLWQKFKKFIGLGSDEDIAETESKLASIGSKLNDLKKNAPKLEWKMQWDKDAKLIPDWASKFFNGNDTTTGTSGSGNNQTVYSPSSSYAPSGNAQAGFYSPTNSIASSGNVQAGLSGISSGGSRPTTINITLGKLNEVINISSNGFQEGIDEMEDKVTEALLKVLNSANKIATQ